MLGLLALFEVVERIIIGFCCFGDAIEVKSALAHVCWRLYLGTVLIYLDEDRVYEATICQHSTLFLHHCFNIPSENAIKSSYCTDRAIRPILELKALAHKILRVRIQLRCAWVTVLEVLAQLQLIYIVI